ncbi:MAG: hypothetical protein PUB67_02715 [Clostridiales bacterium]|nr:hypothetical protein [Clostridiales bacterium]
MKKKLNNNRGASIVFALIAFMLSAVICSIVLVGANTAVKRIAATRKSIQENVTLESAALLLKEDLRGCEYRICVTKTKTNTGNDVVIDRESMPDTLLAEKLAKAIDEGEANELINGHGDFVISTSDKIMSDVNVSFVVSHTGDETFPYLITFTMKSSITGECLLLDYTLHLDETVSEINNGNTVKTIVKKQFKFINPQIHNSADMNK